MTSLLPSWSEMWPGQAQAEKEVVPRVYRYFVTDLMTGEVVAEIPFTGVTYSRKVKKAGEFSGTASVYGTDADLYAATRPGRSAIYVTRNEVAVWGGIIWSRSYSAVEKTIRVGAASFESYLHHRVMWESTSYANTSDQYSVVRSLLSNLAVDFEQSDATADTRRRKNSSDLQIEVVPGLAGKTQDTQTISKGAFRTVGEFLEDYSDNLGGFEYRIDVEWVPATQRFRKLLVLADTPPSQKPMTDTTPAPMPGLTDLVFEHPGSIINVSIEESAEDAATRYWVSGALPENLPEDARYTGVWVNDAALNNGYPILDEVESGRHSEVSIAATLNSYAQRYGRQTAPPVATIDITVNGMMDPRLGTYNPGDYCRIMFHDDPYLQSFLAYMGTGTQGIRKRIMGYSVTVPDVAEVPDTVTLSLLNEWESDASAS